MGKNYNLHRDYNPSRVVDHIKSSIVRGAIIKLRFKKKRHRNIFQFIFGNYKDIYFWLPYKNVVDISDKYSVIGSATRFPYSACWFEVKETSDIYGQGLNDFIFNQRKLSSFTHEVRIVQPFLTSELLTLTRKLVIKKLDDFMFKKHSNNNKK